MGKKPDGEPVLLKWSKHVPVSDVQDPLGLALRGSARLASRLLFCITSITPRARYFAFIPWCVLDYVRRERGKPHALGLREAIALRERALTLGCVAHHDGGTYPGGGLVGSRSARAWLGRGLEEANFKKLKFTKDPAHDAYFNSLVNLGFFVTDDQFDDAEEEASEKPAITFDDIELSPLGKELANCYGSAVSRLESVRQIAEPRRICTVRHLREWGRRGGLCELADTAAPDREILCDIFFARVQLEGESHPVRKQSLLLILELCRQLSHYGRTLNEPTFCAAVYYGTYIAEDGAEVTIRWPSTLRDIATRWRMFYFHHFMSVALEGLFGWLVSFLSDKGLGGAAIPELVELLNSKVVSASLSELLDVRVPPRFGEHTPAELFALFGVPARQFDQELSRLLDTKISGACSVAESELEDSLRGGEQIYSKTGLAVATILMSLTLSRFAQWEETRYGHWLAGAASDPYLDLVPPVVAHGLKRRLGDWWRSPWREIAGTLLARYVVQQHQSMSYEKATAGDRCLLHVDGPRVFSSAKFDKIGMGNPRLYSAIQVLRDLALITDSENGITEPTADGLAVLSTELAKMADS